MAASASTNTSSFLSSLQDSAQALLSSGAAVLSDLSGSSTSSNGSRSKNQQESSWWPQLNWPLSSSNSNSSRSSSSTGYRVSSAAEEFLAHLRWSTPLLQPSTRVPLPTVWDARTILAFIDCLRSIQHSFVCIDESDNKENQTHNSHYNYTSSSSSGGGSSSLTVPPVTAAVVAALLLVFTRPGGVALRDVALSPYCVVERGEYWRLLTCHAVHLDAAHLLTNLAALLPDCAALEALRGSAAAATNLLLLGLAASAAYVGATWLAAKQGWGGAGGRIGGIGGGGSGLKQQYYSMVAVGASSLVFALKVWAGHCKRGHVVYGVPLLPPSFSFSIPSAFTWVPTLALTHLLVPQASFTGHMAGVCAGLARAYCVEPVYQVLRRTWCCLQGKAKGGSSGRGSSRGGGRQGGGAGLEQPQRQQQQRQRQPDSWRVDMHRRYVELTGSGGAVAGDSSNDGHATNSRNSSSTKKCGWLRGPARELLLQLGCVGAAVGVYALVVSSGGGSGGSRRLSGSSGGRSWW